MDKVSLSLLSVPAPEACGVELRLSLLPPARGIRPRAWWQAPLAGPRDGGWWDIDLRALHLADGAYEYEFVVERGSTHRVVADPYAEELTDRGAVRPVLHMHHGERVRPAFSWEGELSGTGLPNDNELAICELPMRRAQTGDRRASLDEALDRTMDRRLEETIAASQVNCIQMLPIQDSPDARNGGYGTRFFFAPDRSIGTPLLVRSFIKKCHQRGLRVIMDLVMNHARECPLRDLAFDWFFLRDGSEEPDSKGNPRPAWGGDILRYRTPRGGVFHARNLQYDVASFFITEYHVDGFRLDEFKGIDNYEFIQTFTERAHAVHHRLFGGSRPFLVIAEDSGRRAQVATRAGYRGKPVVDAIWDFNFRDEVRQLVSDSMPNGRGEPPRRDRVKRLLTAGRPDLFAEHEREHRFFPDMANRVTYCTSHDAPPDEDLRLLPYYTGRLRREGLPESFAQEMVRSTFALTLSAAGIPMFLAGEELGEARKQIRELIRMRTGNPALHRNEVEFFGFSSGTANAGFHPAFDAPDGDRLFAFCRTGGKPLGSAGQVVVVANCGRRDYCSVEIDWPWDGRLGLVEVGGNGSEIPVIEDCRARLSLRPYEVRVFVSQPACPDDGH